MLVHLRCWPVGAGSGVVTPMRIFWSSLGTATADAVDGEFVELEGFPASMAPAARATRFLLMQEPPCCVGCAPRDRTAAIDVTALSPLPMRAGELRLTGRWQVQQDDANGRRYQLLSARAAEPVGWRVVTRRRTLLAAPLMCLTVRPAHSDPDLGRQAIEGIATVDLHSHAGGIANVGHVRSGVGFTEIAAPMRRGGMAVACLAVVSDGPTHHVMADGAIHPFREPAPGELYDFAQVAFNRLHQVAHSQGLTFIADAKGLAAARSGTPSVIVAAEGADFLEGQVDRVDEAYAKWVLRHLQLTHYRVNELGDIQTEPPVHGGLTDTGVEVIRRCNRLGIVVDVAHGTLDLVKRAASVTTKPLVLSHTSLREQPARYSRRVSREHARIVADTGGVIGIWPPAEEFGTMAALAIGMARMVDAVGIDHVGLGSDMRGLVGPSIFPEYDSLPGLASALLDAGFSSLDVVKLLGGNYVRVFAASLG